MNTPVSTAGRAIRSPGAAVADAPGAFQFIESVENESRVLRWVPFGESVVVRGLKIPGGVYVGTPQFQALSFAIDPELALGDAEKAEPVSLVYGEVHYWRLTNNQRAFYLRWLRGETSHIRHVDPKPYFQLYLAGLEWHFLVDGDPYDSICDLVCDLAERDKREFAYYALTLLTWWGQLQGPESQFIVVREAIASGFRSIPGNALALAVANLVILQRKLSIALAVEVALHRCTRKSNISLQDLRVRFRERLTAIYGDGLTLPEKEDRRINLRYSPTCPELNNEGLLSSGSPISSVEIPAFLDSPGLVDPIDRLTSSILAGPVINPEARARIATETAHVQKFLADRTQGELEEIPSVPPIAQRKEPDLADSHRDALGKLIGQPAWNEADFRKLAEEFRLRPSGLRSVLNRWSQETWGDLLLEGSDPIQLNPYVVKQIDKNI